MNKLLRLVSLSLFLGASLRAADVTISGLPAASAPSGSEVLPIVQGGVTKKVTIAALNTGITPSSASVPGTMSATDKAKLDAATSSNTASAIVRRDASGNFTAGTITASVVTGIASPINPLDAVNKAYVDAAAAGLTIKTPAVAATLANVTLSGGAPNTLDGVTLAHFDRVLVKNQSDLTQNGIYFVDTLGSGSNGTWTRTTDADTGAELITGSYIFITGGTVNVNAAYTMVTVGAIVIGASDIQWNLFSQITQIQAANIIGQIVGSQVQDAAINTAKFAAGLTPVEVLGTLPSAGNFQGRTVFLTTDNQLYRYTGSAFTAAVPTTGLSGQITTTQITDTAITAPKMAANSITAGTIAANAVTSGTIAANAVTAGTISAGAVNTTELAAGAVNASKIASNTITAGQIAANTITAGQIATGTITADRMNVSALSAITANLGTVTAGSLTASSFISVGSGKTAVNISASNFSVGDMSIVAYGGVGTQITFLSGSHQAVMYSQTAGSAVLLDNTSSGSHIYLFDTGEIRATDHIEVPYITGLGSPVSLYDGANNIYVRYDSSLDLTVLKVGVTDFINMRAGSFTSSPGATASGYVTLKLADGSTKNFLVQ